MLEYPEHFSEGHFRSHKIIVLMVKDTTIGPFLLRVLNREKRYYTILVSHEHQVLKVVQEVKPDLFVLDADLSENDGFALYDQLHAMKGFEGVPAILNNFSARFPSRQRKKPELRDYDEPSELESFFHTIQEVLL